MGIEGGAEQENGELALSEEKHEPAASRARMRLYAWVVGLTPFVVMAVTLWWLSTPAYRRHSQYTAFTGIGYGTRLQHADCDVVIDGDSSAMVGIVPAVIEQRTGLKTCNIAEMAGVKVVNGNLNLDAYLANNRPPRFLVFQFTPEDLVPPEQWVQVATFEGIFFRLQYRPDAAFARWMLAHPVGVVGNLELGLRTGIPWLVQKPLPSAMYFLRDRNEGWLPDEGTALTACAPPPLPRAPDKAWVEGLRSRYGVDGTRVLVDAMPEPACAEDRGFYAVKLEGVTDNAPGTLPITDYTDSGRLHVTQRGAAELSERVSDQLLAAMKERP